MLKATRGARAKQELGRYYIVDLDQNWLVAHHCDPEALAGC
jgi:hypothetical protein